MCYTQEVTSNPSIEARENTQELTDKPNIFISIIELKMQQTKTIYCTKNECIANFQSIEYEDTSFNEKNWIKTKKLIQWQDSVKIHNEDDYYYYFYKKEPIGIFCYRYSKLEFTTEKPPKNLYLYWVNLDKLYIRKGHGENYKIIDSLSVEDSLFIYSKEYDKHLSDELPEWVKVTTGNWTDSSSIGWVYSEYLSASKIEASNIILERKRKQWERERKEIKKIILTPERKNEINTIFEKAISTKKTRDTDMIIRDCKYFYDLLFEEDTTLPSYYIKGDWLFSYFTDLLDSASNETAVRLGLDWDYYNWYIAEIKAVYPSEVINEIIFKILIQNPSLIKEILTDPLQKAKNYIHFHVVKEYVNFFYNGDIVKAIKDTKESSILYKLWDLYDQKLFGYKTHINIQIPLLNERTVPVVSTTNIIPVKYTCEGEGISPEVKWRNVPENIKSLVILFKDFDTEKFHWILYNIPPELDFIEENFDKSEASSSEIIQGLNDFGKIGYTAPCEFIENRRYHAYFFMLYGLDKELEPIEGLTGEEIFKRIVGHVIAKGKKICFHVKD